VKRPWSWIRTTTWLQHFGNPNPWRQQPRSRYSGESDRQTSIKEVIMQRQVSCECGFTARDHDEGDLVKAVLKHVHDNHPELAGEVTPEVVRGWIELVP
jgi:predicted small metal-binding protein